MPSILELFKGSPQDLNVKSDTETLIEQELTGLRVKSLAELNNPLLYGTGAIRIATRSIETTEVQKDGTKILSSPKNQLGQSVQSGQGVSGLGVAKKISEARDAVTSKLGLPTNLIPTTVLDSKVNQKDVFRIKGGEQDTMTNLAQIRKDGEGSLLGQYLKSTGGGTPRTVGKQALGKGVGLIKDRLRDSIMGNQAITTIAGEKIINYSSDEEETYSAITDKVLQEFDGKTLKGRGFDDVYKDGLDDPVGDLINMKGPSDEYSKSYMEGLNLIPFWVSGLDSSKPVVFRALLSSINETVTPTWNSSKFVGNPYNFYTYDGVERTLTFTLMIYCMNPTELAKNWEKIEFLTSKTYPSIPKGQNYVDAPFIKFRLGNMYVDKVAFIESLTYTVDENSGWETDLDGFLLPKIIEVTTTFKFVEWEGMEKTLYNYSRTKESIKLLKENKEKIIERRQGLSTISSTENGTSYDQQGVEVDKSNTSKSLTNINTGNTESTSNEVNRKKVGLSNIFERLEQRYGK